MSLHIPASVQEAPPSARLVYAALDHHGPLAIQEIMNETGVARRTATQALSTLRDRDLVTAMTHPRDHRSRLYSAVDSPDVSDQPRNPSQPGGGV